MNNASHEIHAPNYTVKSIKLSKEGTRVVASAFPPMAIQYADEHFDMVNGNLSPWSQFKELCIAFCRENRLPINFSVLKGTTSYTMLERSGLRRSVYAKASSDSGYSRQGVNNYSPQKREIGSEEHQPTKRKDPTPVHHDKPRITGVFHDYRFWGPK